MAHPKSLDKIIRRCILLAVLCQWTVPDGTWSLPATAGQPFGDYPWVPRIFLSPKWRKSSPEQRRFNVLKCSTGVTKDQYQELLRLQDGKCAICNISTKDLNKNLAVDHCHNTLLLRGLLCMKCNHAIGIMKDDINLL
ncbi:MAG: endonuclease VII domain-containing protein, partial [Patescibacteria group bacterium]